MKILKGNLTETRYECPQHGDGEQPLSKISQKTYKENQVAYMADELGLHKVINEGSDFAVSLHCEWLVPTYSVISVDIDQICVAVYTPPNVAKGGCNIFDEKTGRRSHVPSCNYYSAYGQLLK
jgi:cysteine dioxygenase